MRSLWTVWRAVVAYAARVDHLLLLSDYDGTLTPLVERPEYAVLPEPTRRLLEALLASGRYTVGIISGRALSDLKAQVGLPHVIYAGNHGLEIEGPELRLLHPQAVEGRSDLQQIAQMLHRELGGTPGVILENKGLTLSVHYRLVAEEQIGAVRQAIERVVGTPRLAGRVRLTGGKKVWEVRPAVAWDKGKAIALILEYLKQRSEHTAIGAIFLGDDRTDEDGFAVVREAGGIAIFVGEPPAKTAAQYAVADPQEVQALLRCLSESSFA